MNATAGPPSADPCFFVLGYGRSGTTLFRRMLAAHPALFVPPENDAFQRIPPLAGRCVLTTEELAAVVQDFPPYFDDVYDVDEFVTTARDLLPLETADLLALLQRSARIGRDKTGAQWGHKSPSEWPYVSTWQRWYPRARFLHVVRHPHDATASMNEYQLQRYRTTPLVSIWQWRKAFRSIRRQGSLLGPSRYQLVRYEDLVADPAPVLAAACDFLGVGADQVQRMADYLADPSAAHVDGGVHMERTDGLLTEDRIGRAEHNFTPRQAIMLDHVVETELATLGYEPRGARAATRVEAARYDAACYGLDTAWAGLRSTRVARGQL